MNEMLLLGAGASVEAKIPSAYEMAKEIHRRYQDDVKNYRGSKENKSKLEEQLRVFNLVYEHLAKDSKKRYGSSAVDVEALYNAFLLLEGRETLEISPFVKSWDSFLKTIVDPKDTFDGIKVKMNLMLKDLTLIKDVSRVDYLKPILDLVNNQNRLVIATLNYDNAIELVSRDNGVSCDTGIKDWDVKGDYNFSGDGIKLLKLHGSIYWRWTEGTTTYDLRMPHRQIRYKEHFEEPEGFGVSVEFPLVIFGHHNKLTAEGPFLDLLKQFDIELSKTNLLTVIGYSFRDPHINFYISKYLNRDNRIRVVIPNFEKSDVEYIVRLRNFRELRANQIEVEDKFSKDKFTGEALIKLYSSL